MLEGDVVERGAGGETVEFDKGGTDFLEDGVVVGYAFEDEEGGTDLRAERIV